MTVNKTIQILLAFFLLSLLGCEMAPTDRTGMLEVSIARQETDRFLPENATNLVVFAYPSYSDGLTSDMPQYGLYPYMSKINAQPGIIRTNIALSDSDTATISGMSAGEWTFIILVYNEYYQISSLTELDPSYCSAYAIVKNVSISNGYNYLDITLLESVGF
jgi:hypothetical protein